MLRSDVAAHGGAPVLAPELDAQQHRANDQLWRSGGRRLVAAYANRVLRPAEVLLLVRHREALSGRVLELGCGAGRLTGYLVDIARAIVGIDISPAMVAYCRERYPRGTFREGDLRDLATIERGSFDVVVAAYNILDALTDAERAQVLDGIHAVLPPDGLLIFSSHNRAFAPRIPDAMNLRGKGLRHLLVTAIHLPGWRRNRRRLLPFEHEEEGHAILNDSTHDFSALHYYITRDAQERQLAAHGFRLLECLDLDGRSLGPREPAPDCPELHYVARRIDRARIASDR
jgi:SAM-dependent methyltransferase